MKLARELTADTWETRASDERWSLRRMIFAMVAVSGLFWICVAALVHLVS